MKKTLLILFIAAFFALCVLPSAGMLIAGPAPLAANETAAAKPKLIKWDGSVNTAFLEDCGDYLSKSFFARLECITAWDGLCAKLFGTSVNDDIVPGKDGWLFYFTAADDRSGASLMTDAEIVSCARNVALMQEYVESIGGRFLFTVPNAKYDLYTDYVRDYAKVSEGRNVDLLQEQLKKQGVSFCDMYALFSSEDEILYWHTDSHWNGRGAALAADGILAGLGREAHWFTGAFIPAEAHTGDLYEMLYPTGALREDDWLPVSGYHFDYVSAFSGVNDMEIETSCPDGEGTLLMYRDSFGRNLYPYLAQEYASAFFSRESCYDLCRMETVGAADVAVELGQRNIVYLLRYGAVYPAPARDACVLTDTQKCDCVLNAENAQTLTGFVKLTGELGGAPGAPVYVSAGGRVFEAQATESGFAAFIPADCTGSVAVYIGK